jgi:signal transduction histidine kinase
VLGTAIFSAATVVTVAPHAGLIDGSPAQQAALETAALLIAVLAGFLVFGRLQRNSGLGELLLVTALAIITLSNLLFVMVPILMGGAIANPAVTGRVAGALLFTAAAFVPRIRLRRPVRAQVVTAIGVLGFLGLTDVLTHVLASVLPPAAMATAAVTALVGSHAHPALVALQIAAAALAGLAAVGYLRRSEQDHDEFSGWLAIAAVFAAASHAEYALDLTIYTARVSMGDLFRFCFYAALLVGSMREIRSHWRTLASVLVTAERRRIARDLHDGLSQELAYMTRKLSGQPDVADKEMLPQLQASVDRARLASRQAIDTIAAPVQLPIAEALTEAVGEVAERFGLELELDLASGIGVAPAGAHALVGIACEAVTNVARHSGSPTVSLILERDGGRVRMRVRDSGKGFDAAGCRTGYGLTSMRDRARSVGGELNISSEPGLGCQVEAMI